MVHIFCSIFVPSIAKDVLSDKSCEQNDAVFGKVRAKFSGEQRLGCMDWPARDGWLHGGHQRRDSHREGTSRGKASLFSLSISMAILFFVEEFVLPIVNFDVMSIWNLQNFGLTAPLPIAALAVTGLAGALIALFIFQSAAKN